MDEIHARDKSAIYFLIYFCNDCNYCEVACEEVGGFKKV
jgi:hypothetical protein